MGSRGQHSSEDCLFEGWRDPGDDEDAGSDSVEMATREPAVDVMTPDPYRCELTELYEPVLTRTKVCDRLVDGHGAQNAESL
jgi:hypothetical protein